MTDSLRATDDASKAVQQTPHRVTLDNMLARITHKEFYHPQTTPHMTIAIVTLDNGFVLVGRSTPADPENFNEELGAKFAFEDTIRQMWPLEAYLLREALVGMAPRVKRSEEANPGELLTSILGEPAEIFKATAAEQFHCVLTLADNLRHVCDAIGMSCELSVAKNMVDEAVMWAEKHIRGS